MNRKRFNQQTLINKCYVIRRQRENKVSLEEYQEPVVEESSNEDLYEMLSVLEERYRVPMMLFYGQGYKIEEIAKMLHIPKSTIQTRLARGRKKLATYYRGEKEVVYESV